MVGLVLSTSLVEDAYSAEYICSWWREKLMFSIWSGQAGQPRTADFSGMDRERLHVISILATDGTKLSGYLIRSLLSPPRGQLLVLQGNGHRASFLLRDLEKIADAGYDIRIYDFRGYATSGDSPRSLHAMIADYRHIVEAFIGASTDRKFIYAMSFGAIIALNSLQGTEKVSKLILDSVPDTVSSFGCPVEYDPIQRATLMQMPVTLMISGLDGVVRGDELEQLRKRAKSGFSWRLVELKNERHPFTPGIEQTVRMNALVEEILAP